MCRNTRLLHRPACCRKALSCPDSLRITQQGRETLMPCIPAATADRFHSWPCHACCKDIASAKALHMHVAQSVAHTSVWLCWAVRFCSSSSISCWALTLATRTKLWPKHPNNTANNTVQLQVWEAGWCDDCRTEGVWLICFFVMYFTCTSQQALSVMLLKQTLHCHICSKI